MAGPLFSAVRARAAGQLSASYRYIAARERTAQKLEMRAAALLARAAEARRLAAERREWADHIRDAAGFRERPHGAA